MNNLEELKKKVKEQIQIDKDNDDDPRQCEWFLSLIEEIEKNQHGVGCACPEHSKWRKNGVRLNPGGTINEKKEFNLNGSKWTRDGKLIEGGPEVSSAPKEKRRFTLEELIKIQKSHDIWNIGPPAWFSVLEDDELLDGILKGNPVNPARELRLEDIENARKEKMVIECPKCEFEYLNGLPGGGAILRCHQGHEFEHRPKKDVSRKEKNDWKKGIDATLETEHLDFLVIILDRLKGISEKTNHSNRDTMKLNRIIDELGEIIDWNKKVV